MNLLKKQLISPAIMVFCLIATFAITVWDRSVMTADVTTEIHSSLAGVRVIYQDSVKSFMNVIEAMALDPLIRGEPAYLNTLLFRLRLYPAVKSAYFIDPDETIIADGLRSEGAQMLGEALPPEHRYKIDAARSKVIIEIRENDLLYSYPFIHHDTYLGRLQAVFSLDEINVVNNQLVNRARILKNAQDKRQAIIFVMVIMVFSVAVIISIFIVRAITFRARKMVELMSDMSINDDALTHRLDEKGNDEFSKLAKEFNKFSSKIRGIVVLANDSSTALAVEAENLSSTNAHIKERTTCEQDALGKAVVAMGSLAAAMGAVTDHATEAAISTQQARENAVNGQGIVAGTISCINTVEQQILKYAQCVEQVAEESKNIEGVLMTIAGISEQTNLLALNAAIEAARAGDSGRGFAVVADEVRNLSLRARRETENIATSIKKLQLEVEKTVAAIEHGRKTVGQSVSAASAAGDALVAIVASVDHINEMNARIASSMQEQSCNSKLINEKIIVITKISEETANMAMGGSRSSQELNLMATRLKGLVSQFLTGR